MGKKVFISYKYSDDNVQHQLIDWTWCDTVRDYVSVLQNKLKYEHINKGEQDGEDLSGLSEDTIERKLRDRIWDSSVTIVMISPGMRLIWKSEKQQWIPREISYSLREVTRGGMTSHRNAIVAVALPDIHGMYDYAIQSRNCMSTCSCNLWQTSNFFPIIRSNMFNLKDKEDNKKDCDNKSDVYTGEVSYISLVRWKDFYNDPDKYIESALARKDNVEDYKLTISLQDTSS